MKKIATKATLKLMELKVRAKKLLLSGEGAINTTEIVGWAALVVVLVLVAGGFLIKFLPDEMLPELAKKITSIFDLA